MSLSLQECIRKVKEEYPDFYPYAFIEMEGKYIFNLKLKGVKDEDAIAEIHVVDPATGHVSGFISPIELLKNDDFREKWKHANLVHHHDEDLQHELFGFKKKRMVTP